MNSSKLASKFVIHALGCMWIDEIGAQASPVALIATEALVTDLLLLRDLFAYSIVIHQEDICDTFEAFDV